MYLTSIFNEAIIQTLRDRFSKLSPHQKAIWGSMNSAQMLAHINVMFELAFENIHEKPNPFIKFMLQLFVKRKVVNDVPYPKNGKSAPVMIITHQPDFDDELRRTLSYLEVIVKNGERYFHKKHHPYFGELSSFQWSNLFYKHLDHHLTQFGV